MPILPILSRLRMLPRRTALVLAALAGGAQATTYTIGTTSMNLVNDGTCGFREAIAAINAGTAMWGCAAPGAANTINLSPGTYTAPVGMDITRSVDIICPGTAACNVEAGNFSGPVFHLTGDLNPSVLFLDFYLRQPAGNLNSITGISVEAGTVRVSDMSIEGFRLNGLVIASGTGHTVQGCIFLNNASEAVFVAPDADLDLNGSIITGSAISGIATGANGKVTTHNLTIATSGQSAISLSQGTVYTDEGSTLFGNGGAGIDGAGDINLTGTIIRGNRNGGVRLDGGFGELANCVIDSNSVSGSGGGVAILVPSFANIKSTSITRNTASVNGGGMYMTGGANLYHCTVSGNTAVRGGGIYHNPGGSGGNAYVEMYQGTVAFNKATNSGGGVYPIAGSSPFRTYGCIVAKNTAPSNPDVSGFINSFNTMYANVSGFTGIHNTDYFPFDPLLGALMGNAGPNKGMTHALLKGSPALDKINDPGSVEAVDGRGFPRPAGGLWDLGAYEAGPYETELLTVIGKSSDSHTLHSESGLSNRGGTVLGANAVGDFVTYAVAIPEPGTYDIALRIKAGPNRPIVELATAPGTSTYTVIGSVDMYRSSLAYVTRGAGSFTFTSAGIKYFRLKVTGLNASSTGYTCFYDYINLSKQ